MDTTIKQGDIDWKKFVSSLAVATLISTIPVLLGLKNGDFNKI